MILKASQRGGAKQCGLHLLKTTENEHVEVHEVSGFMAEDLMGALREAEAISKGTRCKQFLFSLSLSPPEHESVRIEVFEKALATVEERTGLTGQPRVIVFHEKEGRSHCHAATVQRKYRVGQIAHRPRQPIKSPNDNRSRGWDYQ